MSDDSKLEDLAEWPSLEIKEPEAASRYTREVLQHMRKLCLPKPDDVSLEAWEEAVPEYENSSVLRSNIARQLAKDLVPAGDKSIFAMIFPKALDTMLEIMEDPAEAGKTRLAAAMYVADQYSGKATQQVEHSGNFQVEFRRAAQEIEARYRDLQAKQLTSSESTQPEQIDIATQAVDAFLNSHVGSDDFKVGKRGELVEESEQESREGLHQRAGDSQQSEDSEG